MSKPPLLLVEDDPAIAHTAAYALERDGFEVTHVLLLGEARQRLAGAGPRPAVLILDIGLPDGSGLDLCRELRQAGSPLPIILLTARNEEMDRVLGLELGADDYLSKPFSPRELCARVRALLRRSAMPPAPAEAPSLVEHDEPGCRIRLGAVWLRLTRLEYWLLATLLRRPGQVWSREALLDTAWGHSADSTDRTVDTHIKTLRAKLREVLPTAELIVTHRGLGYSLELPASLKS
jgi:two-component system catabolic regulation response regulator CreB